MYPIGDILVNSYFEKSSINNTSKLSVIIIGAKILHHKDAITLNNGDNLQIKSSTSGLFYYLNNKVVLLVNTAGQLFQSGEFKVSNDKLYPVYNRHVRIRKLDSK
jgi:hypothetical protein